MKIQQYRGDDPRIFEMLGHFAMSPKVIREMDGYPILSNKSFTWFVAFEDMKVVGFVAAKLLNTSIVFTYDFVATDHRLKGIYKQLFAERMKWAKTMDRNVFKADCSQCSLKIYIENGFVEVRKLKKWIKVERKL